jgi:hypothetical protein
MRGRELRWLVQWPVTTRVRDSFEITAGDTKVRFEGAVAVLYAFVVTGPINTNASAGMRGRPPLLPFLRAAARFAGLLAARPAAPIAATHLATPIEQLIGFWAR